MAQTINTFLVASALGGIRTAVHMIREHVRTLDTWDLMDQRAQEVKSWMENVTRIVDRIMLIDPTLKAALADFDRTFKPAWSMLSRTPTGAIDIVHGLADSLCTAADKLLEAGIESLRKRG